MPKQDPKIEFEIIRSSADIVKKYYFGRYAAVIISHIRGYNLRYLIAQNKGVKARSALQWLRGQDTDITFELAEMENANIIAKKNQIKFSELFSLSYFKPLGISLGLMFIQQFSGINAVMFYSVSIFKVSSFVMYISSV